MDMRSTKSFRSKRKAIVAGEETNIRTHGWPSARSATQGARGVLLSRLPSHPSPPHGRTLLQGRKAQDQITDSPQQVTVSRYVLSTCANTTIPGLGGNFKSCPYTRGRDTEVQTCREIVPESGSKPGL